VIINGLAAILFMVGYILFGIAMIRTATLPRWSGVLVAVGGRSDRFPSRRPPGRNQCRVSGPGVFAANAAVIKGSGWQSSAIRAVGLVHSRHLS
jgi:hypothetical protein